MMRISKKKEVCGFCTASLWWIPSITYLIFKINNVINPNKEWVWWVGIPLMFLLWLMINYKIKNNND